LDYIEVYLDFNYNYSLVLIEFFFLSESVSQPV